MVKNTQSISVEHLLQSYNIAPVRIDKLEGYISHNYKIQTEENEFFVLKHYRDIRELELIQAENKILDEISPKLPFQLPISLNRKGKAIHEHNDQTFSRLVPFIEGQFLDEVRHSDTLLFNFGKAIAELNVSLKDKRSSAIESRKLLWDLQHNLLNKSKAKYIQEPEKRKLVEYFFDQYEQFVLPHLQDLRYSIIHGDLNIQNVLTDGKIINGVIDFGDICYSPLVNELAIALSYIMFEKEKPIQAAKKLIEGYQAIYPLTEKELKMIYYLVPARLCVSLCSSAVAKAKGEDTEYILISEKPAWSLMEKWITINPVWVQEQFLEAAGYKSGDYKEIKKKLVSARERNTGKSLRLSYHTPIYMTGASFQYMYDQEGNTYLDAYNNIPHVGHCHPSVSKAISKQLRLLNTNTRYVYDTFVDYTQKLLTYFPPTLNKVFLVNSGSEATDLAIRMANVFTGREHMLVLDQGYHGITNTGINVSSYKFDGKGGRGLSDKVTKLSLPKLYNGKFSDADSYGKEATGVIDNLIGKGIIPSAFIGESISGCGGQVPLAPGYLKAMKSYFEEHNILSIIDEVQTGFGRLGEYFWGFQMHDIIPDIVVLGKPMGNGHPVAAVVTTERIADAFANGIELFSSFGGNSVSCAAAKAVLEVIEEEKLSEHARDTGEYFVKELESLQKQFPAMGDIRGLGLFLGIEFVDENLVANTELASFVKNQLKNSFILSGTDGPYENILKIKPPMCFNRSNVEQFIEKLHQILKTRS
ncbi:MAG: aminotransferase class III-fold pyridoxal phosphate-dependent enzyme [Bacteroidales bacterium]|nr:aminotransferase class III-fold pyridoxal phosphate-dependent enzyme [Bacteroidales bacterium]